MSAYPPSGPAWWRDAVIYQIYPRSFADSDGDGIGDLPGITARLEHLVDLGVDAVWLSPFYPSPMRDGGYDVSDYRDVHPTLGTLDDAQALIERTHELGLKVLVDLVPNHSSSEHPWFQAALVSAPGSPERARYLFRDGSGPDGSEPPNDWRSVFGGPAWSRTTNPDGSPGQWYLHLFDPSQPDFDWHNPEVGDDFERTLRFWLDRGADGFRVDVASGLFKRPGLPHFGVEQQLLAHNSSASSPMWDQDEVHDVYRRWRRVCHEYNPSGDPTQDRILVAEAWVHPAERHAAYVRHDEMHQAFNFDYLRAPWNAERLRAVVDSSLHHSGAVGAPATWALNNHDVVRTASRYGLPQHLPVPNGIGPDDPQPDHRVGLSRALAAFVLQAALPGAAYLYQGEELGLPDHTTLGPEHREDPTYARSSGRELGRDGCRIPFPWDGAGSSLGFSPTGRTWLPQPSSYAALALSEQRGHPDSTYELYRRVLLLRRQLGLGRGTVTWDEDRPGVLSFVTQSVRVVTNFSVDGISCPDGELLVSSRPVQDGMVPPDTTVWVSV